MTSPVNPAASTLAALAMRGIEPMSLQGSVAQGAAAGQGASFLDLLKKTVGEVGEMQGQSQEILTRFLRGEDVEMHDVMAAAQEANLALEFLVELRNKLTTTWQTLMQVQI